MRLPDRGVTIRLEETPGARGHVRLLRKISKLSHDPTVREFAISPAGITINDTIAAGEPPAVSRGHGADHN